MKIVVLARNFSLRSRIKEAIEGKIGRTFGRFSKKVDRVKIMLEDINGPKGGVDKHCKIIAELVPGGELTAAALDSSYERALGAASEKMLSGLKKKIGLWKNRNTGRDMRKRGLKAVLQEQAM
jgi:hypothetical protein